MIFHITYVSDGLKIKGYLGIPNEYHISDSQLQELVQQLYDCHDLSVTMLTCSLNRNTRPITSTQLPTLIYCRGGIGKVGKVRTSWIEEFTNFGYVVFAPSYRGNEGGEGRDEFGGADKEDVIDAYNLLQHLPFIKHNCISIMGFSRGSVNATQATAVLDDVQSLILWGGISDLAKTYEERIELRRMLKRVLRGSPNKNPNAYQERSPINMVPQINCPVLIIHGTNDVQVDFSHGQDMYNTFKQYTTNVEMLVLDGYGHHLPFDYRNLTLQKMFHWMGEHYNQN